MPDETLLAARSARPPQDNIPQYKAHRDRLRAFVADYVRQNRLTPPLSLDELRRHSHRIIAAAGLAEKFIDYAAVLVNNAAWRPIVAAIPYDRRLLLLPNCLRDKARCGGRFDDIGLICGGCERCMIHELQTQAEALGYAVLVAEGSPVVMQLIESGRIEAVVGVSCLAVLEKTFPYMEAAAIPGLAIPLLYDGCEDTHLDVDWLWEAVYLNDDHEGHWLDIDDLRRRVGACFEADAVVELMGPPQSHVKRLGLGWLAGEGKRWRPLLTAGVYEALTGKRNDPLDVSLRRVLLAVECFHKASLIHDDIEDGDATRYGRDTLHVRYGVPIALNVGDWLLGVGYRLLAETDVAETVHLNMLKIAAAGHVRLCTGQGDELAWDDSAHDRTDGPGDPVERVLSIYERKTAPAFDVALQLGALLAGVGGPGSKANGAEGSASPRDGALAADPAGGIDRTLAAFSRALGIAYQVQDDLDDFDGLPSAERADGDGAAGSGADGHDPTDLQAGRPSVIWALAWKKATPDQRRELEALRRDAAAGMPLPTQAVALFDRLAVRAEAMALRDHYKSAALTCLEDLESAALKALLRRVVCKVFNDIERLRCCDDHQASDDSNRRRRPRSSG